jgi:hypothetical protein
MRHNLGITAINNTYSTKRVLRKGKKYRQIGKCILLTAGAVTVMREVRGLRHKRVGSFDRSITGRDGRRRQSAKNPQTSQKAERR